MVTVISSTVVLDQRWRILMDQRVIFSKEIFKECTHTVPIDSLFYFLTPDPPVDALSPKKSISSPKHSLALRAKQKQQGTVSLCDRLACDQNNLHRFQNKGLPLPSTVRSGVRKKTSPSLSIRFVAKPTPFSPKIATHPRTCRKSPTLKESITKLYANGSQTLQVVRQLRCHPLHLIGVQNETKSVDKSPDVASESDVN
ncbi:hypothetical protein TNCV_1119421 [Trichonephila clavipes]|uniref:Uncharacterized protein n=1 Tax=Trichonephila clavipes TaxID=2585209 RepID=A0A8X6VS82_TRICX|nr:hypothetical protein TNCV_1119421 [Trichonephila clavipes]